MDGKWYRIEEEETVVDIVIMNVRYEYLPRYLPHSKTNLGKVTYLYHVFFFSIQ